VDFRLPIDKRRRADIAFTRWRLAVFVDGCFWHGCPEHYTSPAAHDSYWAAKLQRNVERDRETDLLLDAVGWQSLRIWEHTPAIEAADRIETEVAHLRGSADPDAETLGGRLRQPHSAVRSLPGTSPLPD
jgi:DNA mismatch endonuclease (patch repair protein)